VTKAVYPETEAEAEAVDPETEAARRYINKVTFEQ